MQGIDAGLVYINSSTIGAEVHLPFGGVKDTGHCREAGIEGIHEFSETKTMKSFLTQRQDWKYQGASTEKQIHS